MPGRISPERAQKIAQNWQRNRTLKDNMEAAGLKSSRRNYQVYRKQTEQLLGIQLITNAPQDLRNNFPPTSKKIEYKKPYPVIIFSDPHWWPNLPVTPAHSFLLHLINELKPKVIINDGDFLDGAKISNHAACQGWMGLPDLVDELEQCKTYMDEIKKLSPRAIRIVNKGNHDSRFENYIINKAIELRDIKGTRLSDHFKGWEFHTSTILNDCFIWKHRWHGGIHAAYNNVLKGGMGIGTGHTHRLLTRHWNNYAGYKEGVEAGTLADPYGPQFYYCEDTSRDWVQGFVVQTVDGSNVTTELVRVQQNGKICFRGENY